MNMKFVIKGSRVLDVMKVYLEKRFPTVLEPFIRQKGWPSEHNPTGYDTEKWYTTKHFYCDKFDEVWIIENDDRDRRDVKYEVNDKLETMYILFGEELFELFFLEVHGIDLKDKGKKRGDWIFV